MAKLTSVKAKDFTRAIKKIGFYKHITVPMHNREFKKGLLHGLLKDVDLAAGELKELI